MLPWIRPDLTVERVQEPVGWVTDRFPMMGIISQLPLGNFIGIPQKCLFQSIRIINTTLTGVEKRCGCYK